MIRTYKQFIKESIFTFTGVNFGAKTVAQSLPETPHDGTIPRHAETDAAGSIPNSMMYSEATGEYYDTYQIDDLVRQYSTWCKQNSKECDMTAITNTDELDYVLGKMD